jgi:hypothetical protein
VLSKKKPKKWISGVIIDLRMYIRTLPAATPMHLYVQANANKRDSDLPKDERNLRSMSKPSNQACLLGAELKKKKNGFRV